VCTARSAAVLAAAEIAGHDRLHIAVERRRTAAFEFTHLAQYIAAQGHEPVGPDLARDFGAALLVRRVGVGVNEMDHQCLGAAFAQAMHFLPHRRFVERRQDSTGRIDALGHLRPQIARDECLEAPGHAVRIGACAASEFEYVAKPGRGNQPAARSLAFEHGIGRDRGAVDQRGYRGEIGFELGEPADETDRLVLRGR
jgi:hypothetical protein